MLRKTLITLTAVAALGAGSTAMAAMRGGMGAMHSSSMGAMHSGWRGPGMAPMHSGWGGRGMAPMQGGRSMAMVPMRGDWGRRPFARNAFFHNRFHRFHRFHHRNAFFFGAAFAGPYDSCWVWTYWGWRNVCGYPYWDY